MRPVLITQGALGSTLWVPINQLQPAFGIGLGASVTSGAVLTYSVQHTFDDLSTTMRRGVTITRAATVATVVDIDHRLSVGDSLIITGTGTANLDSPVDSSGRPLGNDVATVVDANSYTYTVANSGPTADQGNTYLLSARVYNHSTMTGQTGRVDGNYAFSIQACRLKVTAYTSGKVDLMILQGTGGST